VKNFVKIDATQSVDKVFNDVIQTIKKIMIANKN